MIEALNILIKSNKIELVIFGNKTTYANLSDINIKVHYLGYLHDESSLISLYNSADVKIVPSLQEAFGQTASEALSCGLPVVGFNSSGLTDIIDHKKNGYLARKNDSSDLANGIQWILNHANYEELSHNARNKAINKFDFSIVANQYQKLYEELI